MPFQIVRQDITKLTTDAIVNAANTALRMGGGVSAAIFHAAGEARLQEACDRLAPIRTGNAVITPGFDLPSKYVIHTAGPVYMADDIETSERLLRVSYENSLQLADLHQCESIAFPLISSGIYGYPKADALRIASESIRAFLLTHEMDVTLVLFDQISFQLGQTLVDDIESYIDEHYVERTHELYPALSESRVTYRHRKMVQTSRDALMPTEEDLESRMAKLDEPFSVSLMHLIDSKGMSDVEVYKRANLDRKLFSKIRSTSTYTPSKRTALALAIALELTLDETELFLKRAGYALSHAVKFDVIIEFFIINRRYDVFEINEVLFSYDQPLLGS